MDDGVVLGSAPSRAPRVGWSVAVGLARDIQGLRLAELGWEDACAVTPQTAYATRVKLEHLRWYAGKLAPRKYGALTPVLPEGYALCDAPEPPKLQITMTRFKV